MLSQNPDLSASRLPCDFERLDLETQKRISAVPSGRQEGATSLGVRFPGAGFATILMSPTVYVGRERLFAVIDEVEQFASWPEDRMFEVIYAGRMRLGD